MNFKNILSFDNKSLMYAFRIVVGCSIVWWTLLQIKDSKEIWAFISVIIVSDPAFDSVRNATITRVVNTVTGCLLGLLFIYIIGVTFWSLIVAITVSVFISTSFKNYPTSWKLAPATVAIVMIPAIVEHAPWKEAMQVALARTGEVLYGCVVAFVLAWVLKALERRSAHKPK
jgi:uncharacterized membrane protein YccC